MLLAASEEAVSYGATTFMIYTGAPQNTRRKPIEELNIEAGRKHMELNGIEEIIVHAPYIINLGNTTKPETFQLGVDFLRMEIERTSALGVANKSFFTQEPMLVQEQMLVFNKLLKGLNEVLTPEQRLTLR